eukprot:5767774-Alexandrium_andersonii.AAC.1
MCIRDRFSGMPDKRLQRRQRRLTLLNIASRSFEQFETAPSSIQLSEGFWPSSFVLGPPIIGTLPGQ